MNRGAAFRGQPLLLLAGLLSGWLALRMATWTPPFELADIALPSAPAASGLAQRSAARSNDPAALTAPGIAPQLTPLLPHSLERALPTPLGPRLSFTRPPTEPPVPASDTSGGARPQAAVGHSLMLMAGLAQMEVPVALLRLFQGAHQAAATGAVAQPQTQAVDRVRAASRWSGDGWLLLRQDNASPLLSGQPSYGRSQIGAVLRYDLVPGSGHRPQAYMRAGAALAGRRETELAVGLAARPIAAVPLRAAVEVRVGESGRAVRVRPAAYVVTEMPPAALPAGARAEVYAQAGYVGGEFATAFVDGQARIDRAMARVGAAELSAGLGAWGGAQKGAARLDVGPTAALAFRLGAGRGRVAADYRFRIAGDAEPASGPALTLSAGF